MEEEGMDTGFRPQDLAQEWLNKMSEDKFKLDDLMFHWRVNIPLMCSPSQNMFPNPTVNENMIKRLLLEPLEYFLSGNEDPAQFLQNLARFEDPAGLCARVFNSGDPTYSCRDCAADVTCVLCVDCFQLSEHRNHRYIMSVSKGSGGYCDCGDEEAWKTNSYCRNHEPSRGNENSDSDGNLPASAFERVKLLLKLILEYCNDKLYGEQPKNLCQKLQLNEKDLKILSRETFCTIMYNDESHSYPDVIRVLQNTFMRTSDKEAYSIASVIDADGRTIVHQSDSEEICIKHKESIENFKYGRAVKPLKAVVLSSYWVAHQNLAKKLLAWVVEKLSHSKILRKIFCEAIKEKDERSSPPMSILDEVMLGDATVWKEVRELWHRLLTTGMLKEYENKKEFARIFSENYVHLVKDFVNDDHQLSFSLTKLSLQIFTVPSISSCLVEEHNVIENIVQAITLVVMPKRDHLGKLGFKGHYNDFLGRTQHAFQDLCYILNFRPNSWTEALKTNFCTGVSSFLQLLTYMQEMNSVTRQTSEHVMFDPVWDIAFMLSDKSQTVTSLIIQWCELDKEVFKTIIRHCLVKLGSVYPPDCLKLVNREVANYSAKCYAFDVFCEAVSLHVPLTRLLAGLYSTLDLFGYDGLHNLGILEEPSAKLLIEPALRIKVLISQLEAGTWRRNGNALLHQLALYHHPNYRSDTLVKDIVALQMGASMIESNEFLIHVLNRFGLCSWAREDYADAEEATEEEIMETVEWIKIAAEDFLRLINTLISARYKIGVAVVSPTDCVKKEVIQQLCLESMAHSELNKSLAHDMYHETGLDCVIEELADCPTVAGIPKYKLKPEFYKEYELYHYHYTRAEQSKAEETQKQRKKAKNEKVVFPPPKLPPFCPAFSPVVKLLIADVLLHIMKLVIQRCLESTKYSTDSQVRIVLHLIGHGLNEEKNEHLLKFAETAQRWNIFTLLDNILQKPSLAHHHEMIKWIKEQQTSLCLNNDTVTSENQNEVEASQNCLNDNNKLRAKAEAAKRRCLEMMKEAQSNFMGKNPELFVEVFLDGGPSVAPIIDLKAADAKRISKTLVALGPNRSPAFFDVQSEKHMCILCHIEGETNIEKNPFVLAMFVQRSSVHAKFKNKLLFEARQSHSRFLQERDPLFLAPDLLSAPYVSSCGHVMHFDCYRKYSQEIFRRDFLEMEWFRIEYFCPMCNCIGNTVLPLCIPFKKNEQEVASNTECTFDAFIEVVQLLLENKKESDNVEDKMENGLEHVLLLQINLKRLQIWKTLTENELSDKLEKAPMESTTIQLTQQQILPFLHSYSDSGLYSQRFLRLMEYFNNAVYTTGFDVKKKQEDYRQLLIVWQAVAYTITSAEVSHRAEGVKFFGDETPEREILSLRYLIRGCAIISQDLERNDIIQIRSHFLKLIDVILGCSVERPCILAVDSFTLLVSLTFSVFSVYCTDMRMKENYSPYGNMEYFYLLRLVFLFHITQVLITGDFSRHTKSPKDASVDVGEMVDDPNSNEGSTNAKHAIINEVWTHIGKSYKTTDIDFKGVWNAIQNAVIPFLRCCAKLYEHLTGVSAPNILDDNESAFDNLVAYLGLPNTFEAVFDSLFELQLPMRLTSHPMVVEMLQECANYISSTNSTTTLAAIPKILVVSYPREPNELFSLPKDYTDLLISISGYHCPECKHKKASVPTICLICGTMLCSQSYCLQLKLGDLQVGACSYHAYYCGGGNGIFLRIRQCEVFFLGCRGKGTFDQPPYIDVHGETDAGLRRGNPLTLDNERYQQYRRILMRHGIPDKIARALEQALD